VLASENVVRELPQLEVTIAEKDSPRLVRDVVFVKPAMQYRTRIIEDLARCRKPFRIRSDSEILHENLRPIDKCVSTH